MWGQGTEDRALIKGGTPIRGARNADRGVKTRTMKGFRSFRGRDECGTARRCGDKGEI